MGKIKDLTGQRFGRLTVIGFAGKKNKTTLWKCQCKCGAFCNVSGGHLKSGHTQSCGCLQKEKNRAAHVKHEMAGTRIYQIWGDMNRRCRDICRNNFERYGGRGITVYEEWRNDFQAFFDYVSKLEHFGEESYSLDRINNDGNYEPGNVRWATARAQARNRRSNVIVEYNGQPVTLIEAAELSGVSFATLSQRYRKGLRGERLFAPYKPNKSYKKTELIEYNGVKTTLKETAKRSGICYATLLRRYKQGKRGAKLFKPVGH